MNKYSLLIAVALFSFCFIGCEKKAENTENSLQYSKLYGFWTTINTARECIDYWIDEGDGPNDDSYMAGYTIGINIIDDNTIDRGLTRFYANSYSSTTADYKGGTIVATETYRGVKILYVLFSEVISTYAIYNNKIIVNTGDIFTISGDKLYLDGWSSSSERYFVKITN